MKTLLRMQHPGYYPEIILNGVYEDLMLDGLAIGIPTNGTVVIGKLLINNVRTPLTILSAGKVVINEMITDSTWGDTLNIRQSHVTVESLYARNVHARLPYEEFHVDAILQAYRTKSDHQTIDVDGIIEHVSIPYIDVECIGDMVNGIMLSEFNAYRNFRIGNKKLRFVTEGVTWINANNLSDSIIGGEQVEIIGKSVAPTILIKDRSKQGVCSGKPTTNNLFINVTKTDKCLIAGDAQFLLPESAIA